MDTKAMGLKLPLPVMCATLRLTNQEKELFNSQYSGNANSAGNKPSYYITMFEREASVFGYFSEGEPRHGRKSRKEVERSLRVVKVCSCSPAETNDS